MARFLISDGIRGGDIFIPGQLFAFGNVMLHADPAGRLSRVDSFTLDQEIRFENLEFIADSRGDLVLTKLSAPLEGPMSPDTLTSGAGDPATRAASVPSTA